MNPYRIKLETQNALGASFVTEGNHDVLNSLIYLDDNRMIYPVGHHIALRDGVLSKSHTHHFLEKGPCKPVSFISIPDGVQQITCMRLSPNNRLLLVAQLCEVRE